MNVKQIEEGNKTIIIDKYNQQILSEGRRKKCVTFVWIDSRSKLQTMLTFERQHFDEISQQDQECFYSYLQKVSSVFLVSWC